MKLLDLRLPVLRHTALTADSTAGLLSFEFEFPFSDTFQALSGTKMFKQKIFRAR